MVSSRTLPRSTAEWELVPRVGQDQIDVGLEGEGLGMDTEGAERGLEVEDLGDEECDEGKAWRGVLMCRLGLRLVRKEGVKLARKKKGEGEGVVK